MPLFVLLVLLGGGYVLYRRSQSTIQPSLYEGDINTPGLQEHTVIPQPTGQLVLTNGKHYVASISLGMLESFASNDDILNKLVDVGFVNVVVSGTGPLRHASGTWNGQTRSVLLPSQIIEVKEVS